MDGLVFPSAPAFYIERLDGGKGEKRLAQIGKEDDGCARSIAIF